MTDFQVFFFLGGGGEGNSYSPNISGGNSYFV